MMQPEKALGMIFLIVVAVLASIIFIEEFVASGLTIVSVPVLIFTIFITCIILSMFIKK